METVELTRWLTRPSKKEKKERNKTILHNVQYGEISRRKLLLIVKIREERLLLGVLRFKAPLPGFLSPFSYEGSVPLLFLLASGT